MNNNILTKICANCGLEKPLTAFLQMDSDKGAVYGQLCENCRKTAVEESKEKEIDTSATTSDTGLKIDSKSKVQEDTTKHEKFQLTEDQYYHERDKQEEKLVKAGEKSQQLSRQERNHRENFIKSSFLNTAVRTHIQHQEPPPVDNTQVIGGEEQKSQLNKLDTSSPNYDMGAAKLKYQSVTFRESVAYKGMRAWLKGSPLLKHADAGQKQLDPNNTLADASEEEVINKPFSSKK